MLQKQLGSTSILQVVQTRHFRIVAGLFKYIFCDYYIPCAIDSAEQQMPTGNQHFTSGKRKQTGFANTLTLPQMHSTQIHASPNRPIGWDIIKRRTISGVTTFLNQTLGAKKNKRTPPLVNQKLAIVTNPWALKPKTKTKIKTESKQQ